MAKFLIVGLGNIGDEYAGTRHNIGFMMIDAFAASKEVKWEDKRYGFIYVNRTNKELRDMKRTKKRSYDWFRHVIESNGEDLS